ncbi:DUF1501 domain-containing protein [Luteimonas aquatica]|uniref:DUF1501 domain-containing protein n=1 Tax=Luteimonas aquatica TaxID=450364 RepID=UPI001F577FDD|nr:DUF1501 domain-containing protein [Luteimonas aquatica]
MPLSRRRFVIGVGGSALLTLWPGLGAPAAQPTATADARLLVVMLRGAMDGLHLLPPYADPAYRRARAALAVQDGLKLDGSFALHPRMAFAHELYGRKQLLPVLAIAPPYRRRSHFEAQDCLENGTARPDGARDGWLGRCVEAMPRTEGVAVAPVMPLSLRGSRRAETWSPPLLQELQTTLLQQLQPLYAADEQLAAVYADAVNAPEIGALQGKRGGFGLPQAMAAAAELMTGAGSPRVGFVEDSGWDTHRGQAAALQRKFGELDAGLRAARAGFGDAWARTVVVVVTEFGRTFAVNGTGGTDHGTGGLALLAGGGIRGGRMLGDWPGLAPAQLNDGRDLRATTDLRALFKGVLGVHLGVSEAMLETKIFPDSRGVRALDGLMA